MYILPAKKIAFIAHPRTASTATRDALLALGFEQLGTHHEVKPNWCPKGWVIGTTIRNPLDVLVSWYFKTAKELPFAEWLPWFLDHPNHYLAQGMFFGLLYATHVLRFEHLPKDFAAFLRANKLPDIEIPRRNVSPCRQGRSCHAMYDDGLYRLVESRFKKEILFWRNPPLIIR